MHRYPSLGCLFAPFLKSRRSRLVFPSRSPSSRSWWCSGLLLRAPPEPYPAVVADFLSSSSRALASATWAEFCLMCSNLRTALYLRFCLFCLFRGKPWDDEIAPCASDCLSCSLLFPCIALRRKDTLHDNRWRSPPCVRSFTSNSSSLLGSLKTFACPFR